MKLPMFALKPLALASVLALTACGGGGGSGGGNGDPEPTGTTVSGKAEAPTSYTASLQPKPSFMMAAIDYVLPAAHAGFTGLEPVTGATVELIRIDDDGEQVGDVLASTVTSVTGEYELRLPEGVSLAGNLILRITGASGTLSAMVVEEEVDINPVSQYVLDKFVDDENLVLEDLPLGSIINLTGRIEEFDLTASPDAQIEDMLAQLEETVGSLADSAVELAATEPATDTAVVEALEGTWNILEFQLGMYDVDENSQSQDTVAKVFHQTFEIESTDSASEATLSNGTQLLDAYAYAYDYGESGRNLGADLNITPETNDTSLTMTVNADRDMSVFIPFSENIDDPDEGNEEVFGYRQPPRTLLIKSTPNENVAMFTESRVEIRYNTVDTDNDGEEDAVDPNSKDGDEVGQLFNMLVKQADTAPTRLTGLYAGLSFGVELDESDEGIRAGIRKLNFNSNENTLNVIGETMTVVERQRNGTIEFEYDGLDANDIPYTISESGLFQLTSNEGQQWSGAISADNKVVVAVSASEESDGDNLTDTSRDMLISMKIKESGIPDIGDATYRLYTLNAELQNNGYTRFTSLDRQSTATFDSTASSVTISSKSQGFVRDDNFAQIEGTPANESRNEFTLTVPPIEDHGYIALELPGDEGEMEGYISDDGNFILFRYIAEQGEDGAIGYDSGIIVAVKE